MGKQWKQCQTLFFGAPKSLQKVIAAMKLKDGRHLEILHFFWLIFLSFGNWDRASLPIGIIPLLLVYFLLFRSSREEGHRHNPVAGITMLIMQMLGYYGTYLISPYPIKWHLNFSAERLVLQLFPVITFMVLCASRTPESIFGANSAK